MKPRLSPLLSRQHTGQWPATSRFTPQASLYWSEEEGEQWTGEQAPAGSGSLNSSSVGSKSNRGGLEAVTDPAVQPAEPPEGREPLGA